MDPITLLGITAGTLTTASFLPQVIKTWKSRSAGDISVWMFTMSSIGLFLWIIYGFYISSLPVIVANVVSFALAFTILTFKIRFK